MATIIQRLVVSSTLNNNLNIEKAQPLHRRKNVQPLGHWKVSANAAAGYLPAF